MSEKKRARRRKELWETRNEGVIWDNWKEAFCYRDLGPLYLWRRVTFEGFQYFMDTDDQMSRKYSLVNVNYLYRNGVVCRRGLEKPVMLMWEIKHKAYQNLLWKPVYFAMKRGWVDPDFSVKPSWRWLWEARKRVREGNNGR